MATDAIDPKILKELLTIFLHYTCMLVVEWHLQNGTHALISLSISTYKYKTTGLYYCCTMLPMSLTD